MVSSLSPIPPVGPRLAFTAWTRLLTMELRTMLPNVSAAAQGHDRVTWRYADLTVTCVNENGAYCIRFQSGTTLAQITLFDALRHDWYTARNFAQSIAGHFDDRFTTASTSTS